MFKNKEQLTKYMIEGHVHLSKKDYGFFNNLIFLEHRKQTITTNQLSLFNKLINKYQRQLTKLGHDASALIDLTWEIGVVESKQEFLDAYLSIINDTIIIKSPFNNQFIQNFRRVETNQFVWSSTEKNYKAPFSTFSLKLAHLYLNKFYKSVKYCETVQKYIDYIQSYAEVKYWTPTLVKTNNNFYIAGLNHAIYEHIKDIQLSDDIKTLFQLSQYGIKIDESITGDDALLNFAGNYIVTYDLDNFRDLVAKLVLLDVDHVFIPGTKFNIYNKNITNEIKLILLEHNITCSPTNELSSKKGVLIRNNIRFEDNRNFTKIIQLTNSRPVIFS